MAKRYFNIEKETKALLKKWEARNGTLPGMQGIHNVNDYILRKKGLGQLVGGIGKRAASFNINIAQYLSCASLYTGGGSFSFFAWVYYPAGAALYSDMIDSSYPTPVTATYEYYIGGGSTPNSFSTGLKLSGGPINTGNCALNTNAWNFITAVYDNSSKVMSAKSNNGTSVNSLSGTGNPVNLGTAMHIRKNVNGAYASLNFENVGFLQRALTAAEITFLYNSGLGRSYLEILAYQPSLLTNMVSYWPLNESSGTRLDWCGQNHLAAVNNPLSTSGVVEELF